MCDCWTDFLATPPSSLGDTFGLDREFQSAGDPAMTNIFEYWDEPPRPHSTETRVPTSIESLSAIEPIPVPVETSFESHGELETRAVLVSNLSPRASLNELEKIFAQYGAIERIDSSKLSYGMLIVHYFDIRSAQYLRATDFAIYGQPVFRTFAAPEEVKNSRKPPNNGTIVIFHLPAETPNEELEALFSRYGEIRQIRNTPSKETQRFIEFFDKRDANDALQGMNGRFIRNSRINIEFSLPGGFRRNVQSFIAPLPVPRIERWRPLA